MASEGLRVPLSLASQLTNIQLVELPAEIVAQLESASPLNRVLEIKSQAASSSFASLCTSSTTYKLQVHQTSNSIYILEPSTTTEGESEVKAIAHSTTILEMIAMSSTEVESSTRQLLREKLTPWVGSETKQKNQVTKLDIYKDAPFSNGQLDKIWEQICAWEDKGCFIAAPQNLLSVWKAIFTAATAEGIHVEDAREREQLRAAVMDEDIPSGLFDAILQRVDAGSAEFVRWIGEVLLQSALEWNRTEFLARWRQLLPDRWNATVDVGTLDMADSSDPTIIKGKADLGSDSAKKTTARKWHEKFKKG